MAQSNSKATDPDWFKAAAKKLGDIEEHADEYASPEDGDLAPTQPTFAAVKAFLGRLKENDVKIEEPRFYVSPDGHILMGLGNKTHSIDLRFQPGVHYYYKNTKGVVSEGEKETDAFEIVRDNFRL